MHAYTQHFSIIKVTISASFLDCQIQCVSAENFSVPQTSSFLIKFFWQSIFIIRNLYSIFVLMSCLIRQFFMLLHLNMVKF